VLLLEWKRTTAEIIYAYATFFLLPPLWRFGPFPGHGLHFFFPQTLLCFAALRHFLALNNLVPSFRTSSLQLFLGFQAGFLLPPRLPYRIRFGIFVENRHYTTTWYYEQIKFWKLYHSCQNHPNSRCSLQKSRGCNIWHRNELISVHEYNLAETVDQALMFLS